MASYNPTQNAQSVGQGFVQSSAVENKGIFSRMLRNLSSWGLNYDDLILRNTVGIGINEDPYSQKVGNSMYDFFSQRAVARVLGRKSVPYLDRAYADKRRILREYSIKDEIRDFITRIADETIIYNDDRHFCTLKPISSDYSQEIRDKYQEYFDVIYNRFGFADGVSAWNMMKNFLIDGYVTLEIIWDDKKKNIISFNELRPDTIVPAFEPTIGALWIQYPEDPNLRRIFLDSQIIHVSYTTQADYSEVSYVEGLIKPYNWLKLLEQTRIMFNILNASLYQKFVIPVNGLPRQRAEEQIGQLIQDYSEEVDWDDSTGILTINGQKHLPYNKQLWFPSGEAGTPEFELISPEMTNLNEDSMLKWFYNILKRASKIPLQRFDSESGGGSMYEDVASATRDEVNFNNYISRLRANLKEVVIKPLKLQMCMEFPELKDDETFLNQVDLTFNSNNLFEEWKKLSNTSKRIEILERMLAIQKSDQTPYFHIEYAIDYINLLTPEEKDRNKKYWMESKNTGEGGGSAEGGGSPGDGGGGGPTPGPEEGNIPTSEGPPAATEGAPAPETPAPGGAAGGANEFEF